MYSRKAWGGNVDPFILTTIIPPSNIPDGDDPIISVVVFEWTDRYLLGAPASGDTGEVRN